MKAWWLGLSERERIFVAGGAAIIAVLAAAMLVVKPLANWREAALQRVETAERDYRLVHRSAALAPVSSAANDETPVRNIVNQAARAQNITLTFVNALEDGSVEIQAGPLAPDVVLEFFATLERAHGIRATTADIVRAGGEAGDVRVRATFVR